MSDTLNIMVIGAHPDDCEFKAGGVAALYTSMGHNVRFVSVTNGDAGHHQMGGAPLALRRRKEAENAGRVLGVSYVILDNHDGELVPSLEKRREMIRLIRSFRPDLIMTHRPNDYHPDHRYTSTLVQDAVTLLGVQNVVSDVPAMDTKPVIVYLKDRFQKPIPFTPEIVVDIGSVMEKKIEAIHQHTSQVYEWLPRFRDDVPTDEAQRKEYLTKSMYQRYEISEESRKRAEELYGRERAQSIQWVEEFEWCEYGAALTPEKLHKLFPFFK